MSAIPAIEVIDLWKEYQIGRVRRRPDTFYDTVAGLITRPFRRGSRTPEDTSEEKSESFWALRGVDFSIQPGEVVGIIGRNGAGKSTLLKILSRITAPTRGRGKVRGRLASLLEVGTGFHPELTGRENIFLNAAVLGMSRREVTRKFEEIVAFSEVEAFIDTPVKRYSSGMQVRLAFSVAAHLDVDVLLVDEVLAVGDAAFQEKCLGRMNAMGGADRAVVFVSHDVGAVSRLCTRAILLERGQVAFDGAVAAGLARYYARPRHGVVDLADVAFEGGLVGSCRLRSLRFSSNGAHGDAVFGPDDAVGIELEGSSDQNFDDIDLVIAVFANGTRVFTMHDAPPRTALPRGTFRSSFEIPGGVLRPGSYTLGIGMGRAHGREYCWNPAVAQFAIAEVWNDTRRQDAHGVICVGTTGRRESLS